LRELGNNIVNKIKSIFVLRLPMKVAKPFLFGIANISLLSAGSMARTTLWTTQLPGDIAITIPCAGFSKAPNYLDLARDIALKKSQSRSCDNDAAMPCAKQKPMAFPAPK
jgi:hypothetical protein